MSPTAPRVQVTVTPTSQANTLNVNVTKKKVTIAAPQGSIGSDQAMTSYLTYLIGRYQDYQKADTSKDDRFKYMLIHNALKFTQAGNVWVTLETVAMDDTRVRLCGTVRDTGAGIDVDTQSRLFTPFTQADASTTRRFGGGWSLGRCSSPTVT